MNNRLILSLLTAATVAACSTMKAPAAPAMAEGGVLVNPAGMSLYTYDPDPAGGGKSTCNGPCAENWPPLVADAKPASADWTLLKRDDGREQWAYKGKPLYLWIKDQKPGDRTGDGFKGVWHLAKP